MIRKDDCLKCDDAVWEVNGEPWYHPNTGMRKCATSHGGVATPKTLTVEIDADTERLGANAKKVADAWARFSAAVADSKPRLGAAVAANAERTVDIPGFPRPKLEPLVIAASKAAIDDDKWDAATDNDTATHHTLTLNMDNPTDRAILELSNVIRSKRSDYAEDDDPWSNFRDMANLFGGYPWDAANVLEMCKLSRLKALTSNGREPANESVLDSHRDKAAYAVLAFAMLLDEGSTWEGTK